MTGQIRDSLKFQDEQFSIVDYRLAGLFNPNRFSYHIVGGKELFDPSSYHIQTIKNTSACSRGYICNYEIIENNLYLMHVGLHCQKRDTLGIRYRKEGGPPLFGKFPNRVLQRKGSQYIYCNYENLHQLISYSGIVSIANGTVNNKLISTAEDIYPIYKYKTVYDLTFEIGYLASCEDLSPQMARFRNMLFYI